MCFVFYAEIKKKRLSQKYYPSFKHTWRIRDLTYYRGCFAALNMTEAFETASFHVYSKSCQKSDLLMVLVWNASLCLP
jgi:hypothetical protein